MASTMTWAQFVKLHPGTPAAGPERDRLAAIYRSRFGTQAAAPAAAPAPEPVPVGVTPSAPAANLSAGDLAGAVGLDPTAQTGIADAAQRYATGIAGANATGLNTLQNYAAQLPQLQHQYDEANRGTTNQMAGRGVLRSGLTSVGLGQNRAQYDTGVNTVNRGIQNATTNWQNQVGGLANDMTTATHAAQNDAATRFMQQRQADYGNTYGVGSGTGAVEPTTAQAVNPTTTGDPLKKQVY